MTKWSAKGGARSSLHYGGEGVLIHPPHQGVCTRHGTEELCVTPGELAWSAGGTAESKPISESEVASDAASVVGLPSSTSSAVEVPLEHRIPAPRRRHLFAKVTAFATSLKKRTLRDTLFTQRRPRAKKNP